MKARDEDASRAAWHAALNRVGNVSVLTMSETKQNTLGSGNSGFVWFERVPRAVVFLEPEKDPCCWDVDGSELEFVTVCERTPGLRELVASLTTELKA